VTDIYLRVLSIYNNVCMYQFYPWILSGSRFYRFYSVSWDISEIDKHELSFLLFFDRPFAQVASKIRLDASPRRYIVLSVRGTRISLWEGKTETDSRKARKAPPPPPLSLSFFFYPCTQYPFHPLRASEARVIRKMLGSHEKKI